MSDRPAVIEGLSPEQEVALVCEAPATRRAELLRRLPHPERVIPLLPPAELCFTVKAIGLESASWVLESATPDQVIAALDLDAWNGLTLDRRRLDAWIDAIAECDEATLSRSFCALDPELAVHYLRGRIAVVMKPGADEAQDFQPPEGGQTHDGVFYFVPLGDGDDVAAIHKILRVLFQTEYWTYFRLLQGVVWELDTENQEWALRWRNGRLEDLGFPAWDDAMELYRHVPPERLAALPPDARALEVTEWHLPVWVPSLPEGRDSRHAVFRAISQLDDDSRRTAFYAFVAVANKVAVADDMDLGDYETTPHAIEKAAVWTSRGIEHLAKENGLAPPDVLRRVPLDQIFRIGANLDPGAARPRRSEADGPEPDSD